MPDPIIDPQKDPGGKGDQGEPGGTPKKPEDGKPSNDDPPQYITPTILQGIMSAEKRQTTEQFKKQGEQTAQLQASIDALNKSIAEKDAAISGKGDKGDKSKPPESAEMIELRRTVDELKETNKASDARAADERQKRLDTEFKNTVIAALTAAGCEKPEEAFLVIKPRLTHEPEEDKIFAAAVKSDYGSEDLDLKTYIERYFREDILPHVFKGKMRTGAPAGGDEGGSGSFLFTKEQVFDPKAYTKDPEKHRAAIEQGRVRGLKKAVT